MTENARKKLEEFERLARDKTITSFRVCISPEGMLVIPQDSGDQAALVPLGEELLQSLQMFFYDLDAIEYGTLDYTSLASIIHAKAILERILHKPHYQHQ